jgi:hypothetical protein
MKFTHQLNADYEKWEEGMKSAVTRRAYDSMRQDPGTIGLLQTLPDTDFSLVAAFTVSQNIKGDPLTAAQKREFRAAYNHAKINVRSILQQQAPRLANVSFLFTGNTTMQAFIPALKGFKKPGRLPLDDSWFDQTAIYFYTRKSGDALAMVTCEWGANEIAKTRPEALERLVKFIVEDGLRTTQATHTKFCQKCGKFGDELRREPEFKRCTCSKTVHYCSTQCQKRDWAQHRERHFAAMQEDAEASGAAAGGAAEGGAAEGGAADMSFQEENPSLMPESPSPMPPAETGLQPDIRNPADAQDESDRICEVCGNTGRLFHCNRCKSGLYCSRDCQKAAWREHKRQCA